jgi:hypothetical protein
MAASCAIVAEQRLGKPQQPYPVRRFLVPILRAGNSRIAAFNGEPGATISGKNPLHGEFFPSGRSSSGGFVVGEAAHDDRSAWPLLEQSDRVEDLQ